MSNLILVDVTGKVPEVPECPKHKGVALIPEERPTHSEGTVRGYWRCPTDNHVYKQQVPGLPFPR